MAEHHQAGKRGVDAAGPVLEYAPKLQSLDSARLLRIHGYRDMDAVRKDVREAAERHSAEAMQLLDVNFYYRRLAVAQLADGRLTLAEGTQFQCPAFDAILVDSEEVIAFVMSTGQALDDRVQAHLVEFEVLEALFLETAGWLAIEAATRLFALHLRRKFAPEALGLSTRMGPGYTYRFDKQKIMWDLGEQRALFELFDGHPLPVTLLDSCAMYPKLSRSGLFGLRPAPRTGKPKSTSSRSVH